LSESKFSLNGLPIDPFLHIPPVKIRHPFPLLRPANLHLLSKGKGALGGVDNNLRFGGILGEQVSSEKRDKKTITTLPVMATPLVFLILIFTIHYVSFPCL